MSQRDFINLNQPHHIAIIMDGNGRWAELKNHSRIFGHAKGAKVSKVIIEECVRLKIPYLTLFAFSNENWQRPNYEIHFLMRLLRRYLQRERESLMKQNIRFLSIGELTRLPEAARNEVYKTIEATKNNTGLKLVFALSYGGRQEILGAVKALCEKAARGEITPEQIDEPLFRQYMESANIPDPDLIIRTSGETRISNFFLWESAYSEIHFTKALWPDFSAQDLWAALATYSRQERRFGKTSKQVQEARAQILLDEPAQI
ncbi:MAG: isoprenyl transferase [Pseudomonadota bacterium]|nr:isoprenyl transferase [Pseudomonadota bacterium]